MSDDLRNQMAEVLPCEWCGAEPGKPCQEWDEPIPHFHEGISRSTGRLDLADAVLASDAVAHIRAEARAEADAVRDRKFGNLRWMDGHLQGMEDGRAEIIGRVEAALANHPDACDQYTNEDATTCGWKSAVIDVRRALEDQP